MELIDKNTFLDYKQSDTLVIFGCGFSINQLTKEDIMKLAQFDSVGFN